jgi:MerR family transcriptional regulator, redox-sensitive transcriptional activator SoxR
MNIGEMANAVGVSAPAVRYYESVGLISRPKRISGWWRYTPKDLERLKLIYSARRAGFSIRDIQLLVHEIDESGDVSEKWQKLAETKLVELDRLIKDAKLMKAFIKKGTTCTCRNVGTCIHSRGKAC